MQEKQQEILNEALKLVPFDGWGEAVLYSAAENAGLDGNYAKVVFKDGAKGAAALFLKNMDMETYIRINAGLTATYGQEQASIADMLKPMKIRERIYYILESRFKIMEGHKATVRKTVQFFAMPQNIPTGTKLLWEMADNAWHNAGDTSTDFNYYTKRAILVTIYSSTLLFWLNDDSKGHINTYGFLKRRIENIMQFEKVKGKFRAKYAK